jgi:hypothetical protein
LLLMLPRLTLHLLLKLLLHLLPLKSLLLRLPRRLTKSHTRRLLPSNSAVIVKRQCFGTAFFIFLMFGFTSTSCNSLPEQTVLCKPVLYLRPASFLSAVWEPEAKVTVSWPQAAR